MSSKPRITVQTMRIPPSDPSLPAFALQVTEMVDSYMLWIGTTDLASDDIDQAAQRGNLSRDWACAMPPRQGASTPGSATPLYRSSSIDIAFPMAQRLATRFRKQVFLSVDVPPGILSMGEGHRLLLEMEKGIIQRLKEIEGGKTARGD